MYISFGDRVILLRKKKKLNQEQLAKKLDIPVKNLADYEDGKVSPPLNIAARLADILDTSLDFLACRIDDQPSTLLLKWSTEIDKLSDHRLSTKLATVKLSLPSFLSDTGRISTNNTKPGSEPGFISTLTVNSRSFTYYFFAGVDLSQFHCIQSISPR